MHHTALLIVVLAAAALVSTGCDGPDETHTTQRALDVPPPGSTGPSGPSGPPGPIEAQRVELGEHQCWPAFGPFWDCTCYQQITCHEDPACGSAPIETNYVECASGQAREDVADPETCPCFEFCESQAGCWVSDCTTAEDC